MLGCTHFPVLVDALREVIGSHIAIVDSAHTTAAHALTVDNDSRGFWQVLNVGIALAALAIVVALGFLLRRRTLPVVPQEVA